MDGIEDNGHTFQFNEQSETKIKVAGKMTACWLKYSFDADRYVKAKLRNKLLQRKMSDLKCILFFFSLCLCSDQLQISANLILETEEVRQSIGKLNKEVNL